MSHQGWEAEVIFRNELDEIRYFARYGDVKKKWQFHERRIYDEHYRFVSEVGEDYEVIHEFSTLYTQDGELYVVCAIFGVEYTINLVSPFIEGYLRWLEENNQRSCLYPHGIP